MREPAPDSAAASPHDDPSESSEAQNNGSDGAVSRSVATRYFFDGGSSGAPDTDTGECRAAAAGLAVRELGTGPRGTVYELRDRQQPVAVKVLRPGVGIERETLRRFLRDATDRLRHPNLQTLFSIEQNERGDVLYTMPILRGDSLEKLLEDLRRGQSDHPSLHPLAVGPGGELHPEFRRTAVELCTEVAEGLAVAHSAGIVHGRISPRNLILNPGGRLVLTDFGARSETTRSAQREDGAQDHDALGRYRAPELSAKEPPTPASDIYALGFILFELLEKRAPGLSDSLAQLRRSVASARRGSATGMPLPEALAEAICRATAPDPEERYPNAGAFAAALRAYLHGEVSRPEPIAPSASVQPARSWRVPKRQLAAAAGFVCAVGLAFWAGTHSAGDPVAPALTGEPGVERRTSLTVAATDKRPTTGTPLVTQATEQDLSGQTSTASLVSVEVGPQLPPSGDATLVLEQGPVLPPGAAAEETHEPAIEAAPAAESAPGPILGPATIDGERVAFDPSLAAVVDVSARTELGALLEALPPGLRPSRATPEVASEISAPEIVVERRHPETAEAPETAAVERPEASDEDNILAGLGEGLPPRSLAPGEFQRLVDAVFAVATVSPPVEGSERARELLALWNLDVCRQLDAASGAPVTVAPNLVVATDPGTESGSAFTRGWIERQSRLDPEDLLEEAAQLGEESELRLPLMESLASLGTAEGERRALALEAIARLTREHHEDVGEAGLYLLADLQHAEPLVQFALGHHALRFRLAALEELRTGFAGESFPQLHTLTLASPEAAIRQRSFEVLALSRAGDVVDLLPATLGDPALSAASLEWLENAPRESVVEVSLKLLGHSTEKARALAVQILSERCRPGIVHRLVPLLFEDAQETRVAAWTVLQAQGDAACIEQTLDGGLERLRGAAESAGDATEASLKRALRSFLPARGLRRSVKASPPRPLRLRASSRRNDFPVWVFGSDSSQPLAAVESNPELFPLPAFTPEPFAIEWPWIAHQREWRPFEESFFR